MRLIDADKMIADLLTVDPQYETMIDWCIRVTEAQPTVEPERKKGKWLADTFDEWYCCSACHKGLTMFDGTYDFCPHCGADMRDESDDIPDDIPIEYFESGGK